MPRFAVSLCGADVAQLGIELVEVSLFLLLTFQGMFWQKSASVVASDSARIVTGFLQASRALQISRECA